MSSVMDRLHRYMDKQKRLDSDMKTYRDLVENDRAGVNTVIEDLAPELRTGNTHWKVHSFTHLLPVEDYYWPGEKRHEVQTWHASEGGRWELWHYEKCGSYEDMESTHVMRVRQLLEGRHEAQVEDDD